MCKSFLPAKIAKIVFATKKRIKRFCVHKIANLISRESEEVDMAKKQQQMKKRKKHNKTNKDVERESEEVDLAG